MVVGLIVETWMKDEASEWCMATCDGAYGDMKAFGVAFLGVCLLVCGCRKAVEFYLANELKPVTERDLVEMSEHDLDRVDIARMNLICALAAFQRKGPELEECLKQVDAWADRVKSSEERYRKTFERNPARYDNSYAKFRAVNLVLTIKEDFRCRYQRTLIDSGAMNEIHSPRFFLNPDDVFITGLLRHRRGTCASYPVLIAALGRRLGYPIYLKMNYGHLFCHWDDGREQFNIDTNGDGVDTPPDEYYFSNPIYGLNGRSKVQLANDRVMVKLNNWDVLGVFLETAGCSLEAQGALPGAQGHYRAALKYRPNCQNLQRLAARRIRIVPLPDRTKCQEQ